MSGNAAALQTTWAGLSGSTVQKLATLNAMNVAGPAQDISSEVVNAYLMRTGKKAGLAAFVNNTPGSPLGQSLLACNYLWAIINGADGGLLRASSEPTLVALLSHVTDDARTGLVAGDVTALVNATTPTMPWWQANGFSGPIQLMDLIAAGNLS